VLAKPDPERYAPNPITDVELFRSNAEIAKTVSSALSIRPRSGQDKPRGEALIV
jgi:hypothetical protein